VTFAKDLIILRRQAAPKEEQLDFATLALGMTRN
jgi:hypothetical protein